MTNSDPTVLVAGARTPFGRFMGSVGSHRRGTGRRHDRRCAAVGMCLSGIDAITPAHRMIACGDAVLIDHLAFDGLRDAFTGLSMGALTEAGNPGYGITREAQDGWADGACAVVVTRKSTAVRLGVHSDRVRAASARRRCAGRQPGAGPDRARRTHSDHRPGRAEPVIRAV
ncbi:hypothetical protein [Rhodococcus koreensis]|uniref:hypothetical protein n=1 Tax=Rhodococcus koreensis TaxID=99653 RepID=UPI001FC9EB23|nr:hypothetical protein [Rhodococcus koreensis]